MFAHLYVQYKCMYNMTDKNMNRSIVRIRNMIGNVAVDQAEKISWSKVTVSMKERKGQRWW